MNHPHRYYLLAAPGAPVAWVRALFDQFADTSRNTELECGTPLVSAADPAGGTVAYCCSVVVTEAQRQALEAVESAGQIPAGVTFVRCDTITGEVRHSNHPAGLAAVGKVFDLQSSLDTLGMAFPRQTP